MKLIFLQNNMTAFFRYSCIFLFFITYYSCGKASKNEELIQIQKEHLSQSCKVLDDFFMYYVYEKGMHDGSQRYDLEIYYYASQRYAGLLGTFKDRIKHHKGTDTTYLIHLYRTSIKEATDITDSLKKLQTIKLLEPDRETWFFSDHENLKLSPESGDYELLQLLYLHDFETQILKALGIVHPNYGCLKIIPSKLYDFMIIQNNLINDQNYSISIQNNYMYSRGFETYYKISFQSLKKINGKDTLPFNTAISFSEKNKVYKTNAIPYEKGNYLLTLNFNYELPSGAIKVSELTFEYELK